MDTLSSHGHIVFLGSFCVSCRGGFKRLQTLCWWIQTALKLIEDHMDSFSILLPLCLPGLGLTLGYFLLFLCHLALHHHTFRIGCQHGPFHAGKKTFGFRRVRSLAGPPPKNQRLHGREAMKTDLKIFAGFPRIEKMMEFASSRLERPSENHPCLRGSLAHFLLLHQFAFNQFQPHRRILNTGLNILTWIA